MQVLALLQKILRLNLNNFEELKRVIKELGIDIIIVGPEKPLVDGIVDFLELNKIKVFGPDRKFFTT